MVESNRSRTGPVAIALAMTFSAAPLLARAADMPVAPLLDPIDEPRVTFGTGWYLRGDAAAASDMRLSVGNATLPTSKDFLNSWSAGVGFGYKYNEWLRTDVTFDYRAPRSFSGNTEGPVRCQDGAAPVIVGGATVGSTPIYGNCSDFTQARISGYHVLFNAYVDLGTWWGLTPYVGAGVGASSLYQKASQSWFMNNQVPYAPTWTDPFNGGTYSALWDQSRSNRTFQFAWAAMAGVSYAFTPHVSADLGYRYLGLGRLATYTAFNGTQSQYLKAQEIRLGLRYTPD